MSNRFFMSLTLTKRSEDFLVRDKEFDRIWEVGNTIEEALGHFFLKRMPGRTATLLGVFWNLEDERTAKYVEMHGKKHPKIRTS